VFELRGAKSEADVSPLFFDFDRFKLPLQRLLALQVTKVLLGTLFFTNLIFSMSVDAIIKGWNPGPGTILVLFALPFVTPPLDVS